MMRDHLDSGSEVWSHSTSREFQPAEASLDWMAIPRDLPSGKKLRWEEGSLDPQDARDLIGISIFHMFV